MSCQKGNTKRTRPQKYQNRTVFKNDLHDKSHQTKFINSIDVANVCERCKKIIEWKIKYKKYKALKTPAKCTKCEQKTVKHAYHIMCLSCAKKQEICPKCGENGEIIESKPSREERIKLDSELQALLKTLPERKRRTFLRYINKNGNKNNSQNTMGLNVSEIADKETNVDETCSMKREDLLMKLKSLAIIEEQEDNFVDIDDDLDSLI